jgi:hypothetical protein
MTHLGAHTPRRKQGHYRFSVAVLIAAACAIAWTLGTLFPAELHQLARRAQATVAALRK